MYIVDLFQRMTRKTNIPVLIYLVINLFIIAVAVEAVFADSNYSFIAALFASTVLYGLSLAIALSPVGEWILRLQTGCKEITRQEILDYIMPIFNEVYAEARKKDPSIPEDVKLFMNDDEGPNAFATGRRTVCITRGMLQVKPDQIKATLAHEFGHLAHKDTDLILVVSVGNMIVSAIIVGIFLMIELMHIMMTLFALCLGGTEGFIAAICNSLYHLMITAIVAGLIKLWTMLGTALVMKSARANEYEADEFAYNLGYGNALCALLDAIGDSRAEGLFAALASSHPAKDDRISRLQQLGATYRKSFGA